MLGSCFTHIFDIQAVDRQIPIDSLEVHVRAEHDTRAGRPGFENVPFWPHNITYTIEIESSATDEQIRDLHRAVEDVCPILNLLPNPQSITRDHAERGAKFLSPDRQRSTGRNRRLIGFLLGEAPGSWCPAIDDSRLDRNKERLCSLDTGACSLVEIDAWHY